MIALFFYLIIIKAGKREMKPYLRTEKANMITYSTCQNQHSKVK
ncbi:hypothetical protein HMPREF9964_0573 [Streptococcus dysgalactiae subsp. equisimilis SK1249]|nr:hypothetical protein HMPREF9964_0573 [Streptococcus dysgalactiae subsp. equisimilis SK1249]